MKEQPLTISGARTAVYFGGILVAIVIAWGTMTTQQALTNQKLDTFIVLAEKQTDASNKRLERLEDNDREQDKELSRQGDIIDTARSRGLLSLAKLPTTTLSLTKEPTPTPSAESAKLEPQTQTTITNNYSQSPIPTDKPQMTPTPTQPPATPTPTSIPIVCVIGICL